MSEPVTLEQVAAARESARQRLSVALAAVAELRGPFEEAKRAARELEDELAHIDLALGTAKRAHVVQAAVGTLGVETEDPPVVVVQPVHGIGLPDVFELTAIGPGGVGLYLHRRTRGRGGKTHAVRERYVPKPVLDVLAEQAALKGVAANAELIALRERLEALTSKGAAYEVKRVYGSDELVAWQEKGRGDFGAGSGARKPLGPPGGGRWRWLKVGEQAALASEN